MRDRPRDQAVSPRRDVRTSRSAGSGRAQGVYQVREPVRLRPGVVVDVRDDLAPGRLQPGVAGGGQAAILRADDARAISLGDLSALVVGSVVYDDDLIIRIVQVCKRTERLVEGAGP